MTNRNILVLLSVVFVLVLAWNVLYFTGAVGGFGDGPGAVAPLQPNEQFDVPNFAGNRTGQPTPTRPRPTAPGAQAPAAVEPRETVSATALASDASWGRNPMFTPREIWAVENYREIPDAVENPLPAGGLLLSAVLGDSAGRRMAVINDDVFGVGDVVAGMEIIDVWADAVVFRLGTDTHVLRMNDAAVRLTVRGDGAGGQ
ncbi:MAG: hypothetical protein GKS06_05080 [Acidobacteria bacterium]|nr:hypothetical protein [Acidobacteriota bacterium]